MGPIHKPTFLHLYLVHFMGQMCHLAMAGLVFETGADMWLLLCGLEGIEQRTRVTSQFL